jgi:hypothetical protein
VKREFILAMSMFVAMAVVGTGFALWFVTVYGPQQAPPTLDSRR